MGRIHQSILTTRALSDSKLTFYQWLGSIDYVTHLMHWIDSGYEICLLFSLALLPMALLLNHFQVLFLQHFSFPPSH